MRTIMEEPISIAAFTDLEDAWLELDEENDVSKTSTEE